MIRSFGEAGDSLGNFHRPKGIALDSEGHVYVVDAAFNNFQIFDREGQLLLFVGTTGQRPGTGGVNACCTVYGGTGNDAVTGSPFRTGDTPVYGGGAVKPSSRTNLRSSGGGGIKLRGSD